MKNQIKKEDRSYLHFTTLALIVLIIVYTFSRASLISVFHDEGNTYQFSTYSFWDILLFKGINSNSHLLNTLLIKVSTLIFGLSELSLRIPALCGHIIYVIGSYKICQIVLRKSLLPVGFIVLNFNPFLLELFSIARGYALALGFLSLAIFFLIKAIETLDSSECFEWINRSNAMAALSFLSHLIFINVFLSFLVITIGLSILHIIREQNERMNFALIVKNVIKRYWPSILMLFVCVVIYWGPVHNFMADRGKQLFFGGYTGFWQDTVKSLIEATLYGQKYSAKTLIFGMIKFLILVVSAVAVLITATNFRKKDKTLSEQALFAAVLLLVLCIIANILQWNLFGVRYSIERTAAYYFVLFMWMAICMIEVLLRINTILVRLITHSILISIAIFTLCHFILSANLNVIYICPYDASTKEAMLTLSRDESLAQLPENARSIGVNWIHLPSVRFYKDLYQMNWLQYPKEIKNNEYDYYYFTANKYFVRRFDLYKDMQKIKKLNLRIISDFPNTNSFLGVREPTAKAVVSKNN